MKFSRSAATAAEDSNLNASGLTPTIVAPCEGKKRWALSTEIIRETLKPRGCGEFETGAASPYRPVSRDLPKN